MNKLYFFLFIILFPATLYGQSIQVSGKVFSENTKEAVPLVHIYLEGSTIGSITNDVGEFQMSIPTSYEKKINIIFSCLSYRDTTIQLDITNSNNLEIYLNPISYNIAGVTVQTPLSIIRKAIDNIPNNYVNYPTQSQGYFRELIKENDEYKRLIEAAGDIYSKGYKSKKKDKYNIKLNQLRSSISTAHTPLKYNGWNYLLGFDCIKTKRGLLDERRLDNFTFDYGKNTNYFDNEVLVILVKPRPELQQPVYEGKVYIDINTHTIVYIEYGIITNAKYTKATSRGTKLLFLKSKVSYKPMDDGRWYLGYITQEYSYHLKKEDKTVIISSELLVNRINKEYEKPSKKEFMSPKKDLYSFKYNYDPSFWNNYNIIKDSKTYTKIKADLEAASEMDLNSQFNVRKKN